MNIRKVLKLYQGCFKEVSRVFQDSFWDASRKIEGCFNGVLSGFQGFKKFMGVLKVFHECFKEV